MGYVESGSSLLRLHAQVKATLRKSELSHSRFDLTKVSFMRQQTILSHKYSGPFRQMNSHICQHMGTNHPDSKFDETIWALKSTLSLRSNEEAQLFKIIDRRWLWFILKWSWLYPAPSEGDSPHSENSKGSFSAGGKGNGHLEHTNFILYKTKDSVLLLNSHGNWCYQKKILQFNSEQMDQARYISSSCLQL